MRTRIKRLKITFALLTLTTWMTVSAAPVRSAEHGGGHGGWHGEGPGWHGEGPDWHEGAPGWHRGGPGWHGNIRYFHEHDFAVWRGGHWTHGWHAGHFGWWWVIPGGWYFYPAPIYPYPDPYVPPVVAVDPAQPQAQTWYYCDNPSGYYPYVPECSSGWKAVPATPPTVATPGSTPPPMS